MKTALAALCPSTLTATLELIERRFAPSRWDLLAPCDNGSARSLLGRLGGPFPSLRGLGEGGPPPYIRPLRREAARQLSLPLEDPAPGPEMEALWPLEGEGGPWICGRLAADRVEDLRRRRDWLSFLLAELAPSPEPPGGDEALDFHAILYHPASPLGPLLDQLRRAARSEAPVFLEGESGVGKELFARAVHRLSPRSGGAFVAQNGGALTDGLIESELFGHAKGSFTGAREERVGLLELSHGGTFFLDEVGDLSSMLQVRLLRVLQEKQIRRVGENRQRPVDFRLVCATHRDMDRRVAGGEFRADLWFRVSGIRLRIPPLRERPMDLPLLARHFLAEESARSTGRMRSISAPALRLLRRYRWPGNVRELQNEMARAVALYGEQPRLERWMLAERLFADSEPGEGPRRVPLNLQEAQEDLERRMIRQALLRHEGNRSASARSLGLSRQGLLKKIQRLELEHVGMPGEMDLGPGGGEP